MMKKILLLIIGVLLIPGVVQAKEYCQIISGSGNEIGSELKCGTESFYVVSSTKDSISMLTKYNLYVGDIINNISVRRGEYSGTSSEDFCLQVGIEAGYDPYYVVPMFDENDNSTLTSCRIYEKINYNKVVQDSRAVGTFLENGKSKLPLYGIVYMNNLWGYEAMIEHNYLTNEYDNNGNLKLNTTHFEKYFNGYKSELQRQNINVQDVSFITLSKTLQLLKDISGRNVEIDLEPSTFENLNVYYGKMNIKDYIGNGHKWIYSTTYWLGSGFYGDPNNTGFEGGNDYYISNEGMLCAIGRGECTYLPYPIGNGLRPLVTIAKSEVAYKIKTKTNGHGSIEVVKTAYGNDRITFRVNADKGYKLSTLIVTTDSNEKVVFDEGKMIYNKDGTVSISNNAFTMPFENVTIDAQFRLDIKNPKTGITIMIITLLMMFGLGMGVYIYSRKINN